MAEDTRERTERTGSSAADGAAAALSSEYFETATRVAQGNQIPVPTRSPVQREDEGGNGGGSGRGGSGDNSAPVRIPIPRPEPAPVRLPKPRPYDLGTGGGGNGGDGNPDVRTAKKSGRCKPSPTYLRYIETADKVTLTPGALNIEQIRNKYNCQIKTKADAINFAEKEIEGLGDPFTRVDKESELNVASSTFTFGLDATYAYRPGKLGPNGLEVENLLPGGSTGVFPGDRILFANGVDLRNMEFDEAVKALRGPAQQKLQLDVIRDGELVHLDDVPRATVNPVTTERMLDDKIGYLKISTFNDNATAVEIQRSLERLKDADSIVIDLRGNGGGFPEQVQKTAGLFMQEGGIYWENARVEGANRIQSTQMYLTENGIMSLDAQGTQVGGTDVRPRLPPMAANKRLVVLTDEGTASAAEMFAGALKDNGRAVTIGEKTYGKGVGQILFSSMPGNARLLVTNFTYETPSGFWPGDAHNHRIGI